MPCSSIGLELLLYSFGALAERSFWGFVLGVNEPTNVLSKRTGIDAYQPSETTLALRSSKETVLRRFFFNV
jgi:hypothetical protein